MTSKLRKWETDFCCNCCYTSRLTEENRFCPICFPYVVALPCCLVGKIRTIVHREDPLCCEMGNSGCFCCLLSCCLFCPITSMVMRSEVKKTYNVEGNGDCCDTCCGACYPCSLYQIFVSLEIWEMERKYKERKLEEQHKKDAPNTNKVTEIVLMHTDSVRDVIVNLTDANNADLTNTPSSNGSKNERKSTTSTAQQGNTGMDESNNGASKPRRKSATSASPATLGERVPPQTSRFPTSEPSSSPRHVMRVTIPDDHYEGSAFIVVNSVNQQEVIVTVPKGGKPGMKIDVPF